MTFSKFSDAQKYPKTYKISKSQDKIQKQLQFKI